MYTHFCTLGRVILDLYLNKLQKKPSPLSKQSLATSGITHHQIRPTNQQKVCGHYQSLPSGGRTILPPLASTRADILHPSTGVPCWHCTRHICDVASMPCQHRYQGHHVAVTSLHMGTQPLILSFPTWINPSERKITTEVRWLCLWHLEFRTL